MLPATFQTPAAIVLLLGGLLACFAGYRVFRVVLEINVGMFLLESVSGILSYSTELPADPLPIARLRHKA